MSQSANENEDGGRRLPRAEPDAHGQAALMLAESILHALIETNTITDQEALQVVQTAQEVKADVAAMSGESRAVARESLELLNRIAISLGADQ